MKKKVFIGLLLCVFIINAFGCTSDSAAFNEGGSGYAKGILTDTGFSSDYLNLQFTLPKGFIMATQEDLNAIMDLSADFLDIDNKLIDYAKVTTVYEMMAVAPSGNPNVVVMAERLLLSNMTVEQYFDALIKGLTDLDIGHKIDETIITVEIAGQSYQQLSTSIDVFGEDTRQRYAMRKINDRMVGFVITYTPDTESEMEAMMKGFSKK